MIRLFVVDDEDLISSSIETIVAGHPDILFIGQANSGKQALEFIPKFKFDPGDTLLVIIDFYMPPGMNGLVVSKRLKEICKDLNLKIMMLTNFSSKELMALSINYVDGFVSKFNSVETILEAIERIAKGEWIVYGHHNTPDDVPGLDMNELIPKNNQPHNLTPLEIDIICLVVQGKPNREIALILKKEIRTVENYKERALKKLDAKGKSLSELKHILQFYGMCG